MKMIYWSEDLAAQNIVRHFREFGLSVPITESEPSILYLEGIEESADFFMVPSKHKSAAEKKSLTIHSTGNFGNADYGGTARKLNPTNPAAVAVGLRSMAAAGLEDFEVCIEVTHHGPTIDVPLVFIEIGSSEKEWVREDAGKVVANAIKDICENTNSFENYIGFGGPHYAPSFTQVLLDNPEIAIGHILPNYHAENVTKEIIQEMLEKSGAQKAVFDWKGLKS